MRAHHDLVEERLRERRRRPEEEEEQAEPAPEAELPSSNSVLSVPDGPARTNPGSLMQLQRLLGNQAVSTYLASSGQRAGSQAGLDVLSDEEVEPSSEQHLDDLPDAGVSTAAPASTPDAGVAKAAVPTNLKQIVTSWSPGSSKYGFQLKFQCSSSSGKVADLQAQAPNLVWREYVTYSRNDFKHRIDPDNPTILPPGGVSFAAAKTTVVSDNVLEFNTARDTHWMPTSAVRREDWKPTGTRDLPAIMESKQVYQFSTDGSTWTDFAGPFTLKRTLEQAFGPAAKDGSVPLLFTTEKVGIHTVTEDYKP